MELPVSETGEYFLLFLLATLSTLGCYLFYYREHKIRRNNVYNQSDTRTNAVLPYIGQTEKERGESHEWSVGPMAVDNKQLKKIQ